MKLRKKKIYREAQIFMLNKKTNLLLPKEQSGNGET